MMIGQAIDEDATVGSASLQPRDFEAFYRAHNDEVYRTLAVVIRDCDLAREAADEAMARAFERWHTVQGYDNPSGWVYRVALNWSRSRLRRRKRESAMSHSPDTVTRDPVSDPTLHEAVGQLPLLFREVIVFRFLADLTQEEIAQTLGIRVGTVKSRLHRALDALRKEMDHDT